MESEVRTTPDQSDGSKNQVCTQEEMSLEGEWYAEEDYSVGKYKSKGKDAEKKKWGDALAFMKEDGDEWGCGEFSEDDDSEEQRSKV